METENQNLIYDLTVRTKMNFTRFVLSPRRNPELLNSNEFHRDLGKQCRQFHYQGFAVYIIMVSMITSSSNLSLQRSCFLSMNE